MVQARQFRAEHVDAHYASALFRYEKEFSIKFKEHLVFVSMDDKHTIKVGEPNCPVAAVERGKQVLVAIGTKLVVADHNFTRISMTLSVNLFSQVPDHIDESFYTGQVCVSFKENSFQPSSPMRHMAELKGKMTSMKINKPILLAYTDGGPDHRLTYLSVREALEGFPDFQSIRSQMSRVKSAEVPDMPQDIDDVNIKGSWAQSLRNKRFLLHHQDNDWGIAIFSTQRNLCVLDECQQLYMDATFRTAPRPYEQVFTILGEYYGRELPLAIVLMTNKAIGHYRQVL
ncbi:Hypothetical predicted protein [Paramuricea clavata]|uniref:Uncharacterized protein n=1 Tax=Paramuricea clavata TaxID=317549 RepID=A0A6S7H8J5_PARCT|nr:Hypothetical predicted protein [Paramuricea clavata]